jgi:hypothetical protein
MILNIDRTQAISTLGWVDKGGLWVFSLESGLRQITLSDAKYLAVVQGTDDFFAVVHNWDGNRFEITAHHQSEPSRIISRASLRLRQPVPGPKPELVFEGDSSVWEQLPGAYTGYAFDDFRLILTRHRAEENVQTFAWYDDSYDKGYQGIVSVTEVPNSPYLLVGIQRDSNPVLYDPLTQKPVKHVALVNRRGNPEFLVRASAREMWASDYDSIVKLDADSLKIKNSVLVQGATSGTGAFMGNFCFDAAESVCLIARPYSHDAVVLDANSLSVERTIELPGQPLDIGLLVDGSVITRDWKTGDLVRASVK